jgi:hypothetical protein
MIDTAKFVVFPGLSHCRAELSFQRASGSGKQPIGANVLYGTSQLQLSGFDYPLRAQYSVMRISPTDRLRLETKGELI